MGTTPLSLLVPGTTSATSKKTGTSKTAALSGPTHVRILDHAAAEQAGVAGMLFTLDRSATTVGSTVGLSIEYKDFAQAYGGAYADRVRLVELPGCAVTTPDKPACQVSTPVPTKNDRVMQTLSATAVTVPAAQSAVFALDSATSSDQGDYKATSLAESAAWSTNLNTGSFTWSYPIQTPGVPGSFAPSLGLNYSSGAVDGRTSSTNNQASWAGDGFSMWSGSIERAYKQCADDDVTNADGSKPGDLCWSSDDAILTFGGHSGELIATGTNSFRLKDDDGTKVDRIYGSSTNVRANGAHDDEYWRVTTTDGSRYYFGYNRLPGWDSTSAPTNSTWTVPVFGDDAGEPCHASTFADSWCQQGWRWNLDYAVDSHGNAMAYYYNTETNTYGRDGKAADETSYDRGGTLDHIDYGFRDGSAYSTQALARVDFDTAERCLESDSTCGASSIDDDAFYWYDTPWDLNCDAGKDCTKAYSPSFWTRKRLTDVTTSVLKSGSTTYTPVDTWHLEYGWGMADIDYQLELKSIQYTGLAGTPTVQLPKVTFGYDQRTNRLDIPGDDTSPFIKERVSTVIDEYGGQIDVQYSTATCDAAHLPTPSANTTRCYPVYYTKEGDKDPTLQWFDKYVVDSVTRTDRTNASPDMVTRYTYLDGAAWHYDDDDGLTKEKYKTWSEWRGYSHVRVETGGQDPVGMKSQTDHYFLRGMDGDKGSTTPVTVSDDHGGTITDVDALDGFEYKSEQYSAPGGVVLDKTVNTPWVHTTATRTRDWGTTTANLTGTAGTRTWTSLDSGAGQKWRTTNVTNAFEETAGRIVRTDDFGDESTAADDQCTRVTYADNTDAWILTAVARTETVAVSCASTPDRTKDVLSDVRTAFDGQDYGVPPTRGDETRSATLVSHNGTTGTYLESGVTYDTAYGRPLTTTDITATVTASETTAPVRTARSDGHTVTTVYTPATGFPTTTTVTGPPADPASSSTSQTVKTTFDPLRGLPTTVVDANSKRTDTTYDAMGRTLRVWQPNRSKANSDIPNYQYTYTVTDNAPASVATKTLKSDSAQQTAYTIYDGYLQPRQVQVPGPSGGRLVSDTFYDERGLVAKQFAAYYNVDPPSSQLLTLDDALGVETQTWNTYDGLGRVVRSQQVAGNSDGGTVLATTDTSYEGDRVDVTPPSGATPTTTITDARGQTTDLLQYHGATPTGTADDTHYEYTPAGKLLKLTDPSGSVWSYGYDQRGNQTSSTDPDTGTSTSTYDDRNQLVSTTNALHQTITHVYDQLGRETETHSGSASGPLLTKHVWDPSGAKGQLASATSYVGGAGGDAYTTTYSLYDSLYRAGRITTTIPSVSGEEGLAGSYQSNVRYNANGTLQSTSYPAAGSLPAEVITPTYDDTLRLTALTGTGGVTYLTDTAYSLTGKPLQFTYQSGGKKTQVTDTYQWGTQRLNNSRVDREDVPGTDKSSTYTYNDAGTITSIDDVSRDGTDDQCFTYDYLGRLTEAWAQTTATCGAPSAAVLGGPAPYWQSYTYDLSGNRKTETVHDASGVAANDVKRTYAYPGATNAQPHTLSEVDTSGPTGISKDLYTYDSTGNTRTRTVGGDTQTLNWDAEGDLSSVTEDDGSGGTKSVASYVYDADGNRLITRTDSDTTLDLGTTKITLADGVAKATRYYDLGGGNQAIRTDDNQLSFLLGDHQGTSQFAVSATTQAMQQRRSTPFGEARGDQPTSWPGQEGFVGGTQDTSTGLTQLGARDYDPTTGRFTSPDPVLDTSDPQQINGYTYSDNNPVTFSDPSGLHLACGADSHDGVACPKPTTQPTTKKKPAPADPCAHARTIFCALGLPEPNGNLAKPNFSQMVQNEIDVCADEYRSCGLKSSRADWDAAMQLAYDLIKLGLKNGVIVKHGHVLTEAGPHGLPTDVNNVLTGGPGIGAYLVIIGGGELPPAGTLYESLNGASGIKSALSDMCSFTPGTAILMKDGKGKPIGKVKPGDEVATANPKTGKREGSRTVAARLVHRDEDLVDLTVQRTDGVRSTLHTTANHPFWDDTLHAWVPAAELDPGHALITAADTHATVLSLTAKSGTASMYNLTVDQLHTYYVLAGETPVLVHNSNCPLYTVGGPRVRPGKDIDVDADGFVNGPTAEQLKSLDVQGLSTFDSVENASRIGLKGQVRTPTGPLPDGLGIIADGRGVGGPRALGHHTIYPTRRMSFDDYVGLIQGMNWQNIGKKL